MLDAVFPIVVFLFVCLDMTQKRKSYKAAAIVVLNSPTLLQPEQLPVLSCLTSGSLQPHMV